MPGNLWRRCLLDEKVHKRVRCGSVRVLDKKGLFYKADTLTAVVASEKSRIDQLQK
jgi:hypothetical protein